MRLSAYYIDIKNYIVVDSMAGKYVSRYGYSLDSVKFHGVEWDFNSKLGDRLSLFGNYSYRESDYDLGGLPAAFLLQLAPKHKANIGARYRLFEDILLSSDLRYVGRRQAEGGSTMSEYFLTDVGIEYTVFEQVKIRMFANNIFGENYEEVYGFPQPDQTFGISVQVTF